MKHIKFSEQQIAFILRQAEDGYSMTTSKYLINLAPAEGFEPPTWWLTV